MICLRVFVSAGGAEKVEERTYSGYRRVWSGVSVLRRWNWMRACRQAGPHLQQQRTHLQGNDNCRTELVTVDTFLPFCPVCSSTSCWEEEEEEEGSSGSSGSGSGSCSGWWHSVVVSMLALNVCGIRWDIVRTVQCIQCIHSHRQAHKC